MQIDKVESACLELQISDMGHFACFGVLDYLTYRHGVLDQVEEHIELTGLVYLADLLGFRTTQEDFNTWRLHWRLLGRRMASTGWIVTNPPNEVMGQQWMVSSVVS